VTENAQMYYTVCLVRYTGNPVFVRGMIPICTSYNWFKPVKTSCLAETGFCWQKPNPGPE